MMDIYVAASSNQGKGTYTGMKMIGWDIEWRSQCSKILYVFMKSSRWAAIISNSEPESINGSRNFSLISLSFVGEMQRSNRKVNSTKKNKLEVKWSLTSIPKTFFTPYMWYKPHTISRITVLSPGQRPPHVTIQAWTSSASK